MWVLAGARRLLLFNQLFNIVDVNDNIKLPYNYKSIIVMHMPKVSIIVPIYNSERFLDRCISSLVNQTMKDIEIILVSDASPDNSKDIMERYASQDSRVVTIYNEVNGSPNPRNAGILAAKSNYVGFVDADDWVELDMYEKLYEKTNNEAIDVVVSDLRWVNEHDETIMEEKLWEDDIFKGGDVKQKMADSMAVNGGRLFTNIWRKSIITDNSLYFLEKNYYCDTVVGLWYLKAESFAKVNKIMYNYFMNTSSITNTLNNMRIINDRPIAHIDRMERAKAIGIYNKYKDVLDYRFYNGYLLQTSLIFAVRYSWPRYKEINKIKRQFRVYLPEGIKGNRFYKQFSNTMFDKQFFLIRMNTYIGATILWLAALLKRRVDRLK